MIFPHSIQGLVSVCSIRLHSQRIYATATIAAQSATDAKEYEEPTSPTNISFEVQVPEEYRQLRYTNYITLSSSDSAHTDSA